MDFSDREFVGFCFGNTRHTQVIEMRKRDFGGFRSRYRYIIVVCVIVTALTTSHSICRMKEIVMMEAERAVVQSQDAGHANKGLDNTAQKEVSLSDSRNGVEGKEYDEVNDNKSISKRETVPGKDGVTADEANTVSLTGSCDNFTVTENTDFWGEALVWGPLNIVNSFEICCSMCQNYKVDSKDVDGLGCNVWVWCGNKDLCGEHYRECWLKHLPHPERASPSNQGPQVGWMTGFVSKPKNHRDDQQDTEDANERKYHVIITAQGFVTHWQSRIYYYWYQKIKKKCELEAQSSGSVCQMGGFTRILHSGEPDDLMNEIPTFVAKPLPEKYIKDGYVVLNRPYAIKQWLDSTKIEEKYVLMSEPDHLWLKPLPNMMVGQHAAAFPFFYIEPSSKEFFPIVKRVLKRDDLTREESEDIAPIGNAPTMLSLDQLKALSNKWLNMSIFIHHDDEANSKWGWVQEMYAFAMALFSTGEKDVSLHKEWMAQPPWDEKLDPFYLLHYTYGMDFNNQGEFTPGKYGEWRFDKREYISVPPPRNLTEPPKMCKSELVRHLIKSINEATSLIPGWDQYEEGQRVTQFWDGKTFAE